jgi:type II secretory ATPase GspE/PulE/Tfp pilus assembly ATPase PilB-like protein
MTSPIKAIDVLCPQCRQQYQNWHRPSVNLDLDDFDDEYLDECASAICPNCNFKIYFGSLTVKNSVFYLEGSNQTEK